MAKQIFERCEKKYLITAEQRDRLMARLHHNIQPDQYGHYTVANLYFDTEDFALIRLSLDRPVYKEKLRLRSYGRPAADSRVYLELKKKFQGVVYKRREALPYGEAMAAVAAGGLPGTDSQIGREITYFAQHYPVRPRVYLGYDREAYTCFDDPELRITFDENIRFRLCELRLDSGNWGTGILQPGTALMEVKSLGSMPLWLAQLLSELEIFPGSFSKYGTCYQKYILPQKGPEREAVASA